MEDIINAWIDYGAILLKERWPEVIVALVMIGLWRWFMGHKFQQQIDDLRKDHQAPSPSPVSVPEGSATAQGNVAEIQQNPTITVSPKIVFDGNMVTRPDVKGEGPIGQQKFGYVTFGTVHGPIRVSLAGGAKTSADLVRWLHEKRLLAPLGDNGD